MTLRDQQAYGTFEHITHKYMRFPILFVMFAAFLAAGPAWAAPQPLDSGLNTTNIKTTDLQQAAATKTSDVKINPNLPDLNKIDTSLSADSSGLVFKPLPFNPPAIPPELLKGPTITDIKLAAGQDRLKVTWTTNRPATSKIYFGPTDQYGTILENAAMATSHELTLPAKPGTLHFKLSSTDSNKRESTTPDMSLEIPAFEAPLPQATSTQPAAQTANGQGTETAPPPSEDADKSLDKQQPGQTEDNASPTQPSSITATDAALGGAAVLLLGILVGVFLPRRKTTS